MRWLDSELYHESLCEWFTPLNQFGEHKNWYHFHLLIFYVISYITWERTNIDGMQRITLTLALLTALCHVCKYHLSYMLQRNTCWTLLTCKIRRPQTSHWIKGVYVSWALSIFSTTLLLQSPGFSLTLCTLALFSVFVHFPPLSHGIFITLCSHL